MSLTDEELEAIMAEEEASLAAGIGGTTEYDPWSPFTQVPLDAVIVAGEMIDRGRTEIPEGITGVFAPNILPTYGDDVTTRDIFETYNNLSEEERRAVNEKMLSAGFYAYGNKDLSNLENPVSGLYALGSAITYYATQGVTPFDGLPDANPDDLIAKAPVVSSATEAQINALADSAAGNLLGRNATAEERQLAMSVIRSLETSSSVSPSQADVESAFAESAPQEVAARGSEKALKVFESIVRGG